MPQDKNNLTALLFGNDNSIGFSHAEYLLKTFEDELSRIDVKVSASLAYRYSNVEINDINVTTELLSPVEAVTAVKSHCLLIALDGCYQITDLSQLTLMASENTAVLLAPAQHITISTAHAPLTKGLLISFDLNRLQKTAQLLCGHEISNMSLQQVQLKLDEIDFKRTILGIVDQIAGYDGNADILAVQGVDEQFYRLLVFMLDPACVIQFKSAKNTLKSDVEGLTFIDEFKRYIQYNLTKPIDIKALQVCLGISERSLRYKTQKYFGCSARTYWINAKLKLARELLINRPNVSLSALSEELGFSSQSRFIKFFKAQAGVTPSVFKKQNNIN